MEDNEREAKIKELVEEYPYAATIEKAHKLQKEMHLLISTMDESNEYTQSIKTFYEKVKEIKEDLKQILKDEQEYARNFLADLETRVGGAPSTMDAIEKLIELENPHLIPDRDM